MASPLDSRPLLGALPARAALHDARQPLLQRLLIKPALARHPQVCVLEVGEASSASAVPSRARDACAPGLFAAVAAMFCRRWCRPRSERRRGTCLAAVQAREAPPRPPKEDPTPFPREPLFPEPVFRLLELFNEEKPELEELVYALEDFEELHLLERQWGRWPLHVADAKQSKTWKGMFLVLRGILMCIEQKQSVELRDTAISLLLCLVATGTNVTKCQPSFVVEAGAISVLCKIAKETEDTAVLEIIIELVRHAEDEMLPLIIEQGGVEVCFPILEDSGSSPLEQLAALDLLLAVTKRAPLPVASSGAYEVAKGITNVILAPRRKKIMNFLRPLVEHEEGAEEAPGTSIRLGGLKY